MYVTTLCRSVDIRLAVSYLPCAKYLRKQTGSIITLAQFEEGNLSSETLDDAESDDGSDYDSIMPPLFIHKKWMEWIQAMILRMNLCLQRF